MNYGWDEEGGDCGGERKECVREERKEVKIGRRRKGKKEKKRDRRRRELKRERGGKLER